MVDDLGGGGAGDEFEDLRTSAARRANRRGEVGERYL